MQFVAGTRTAVHDFFVPWPYVVLFRDNWDDYGYKTTFRASLFPTATRMVVLGNVKILKFDQDSGHTAMPPNPFERLGEDYCSLGADLDYYKHLFQLGPEIYRPYLEALRDATFNDEIRAKFESHEGFRVSLLRVSGALSIFSESQKIFRQAATGTPRRSVGFKVKFQTQVSSTASPLTIEFDFSRRGTLPNRVNVLIGYNGTGKTRLLSNLAIAASGYGYARKEDVLNETAGRFPDAQPPFRTVVVLSYSAFDTFVIPGRTAVEKARLRAEGEIFGYVYCGLRERSANKNSGKEQTYRLKTPEETEQEFLAALGRVQDANRMTAFLKIARPVLQDASFQRIGLSLRTDTDEREAADLFRKLSSGHKVVLKIVAELTAHIAETGPTLVLIDEPETHLHPPLLAAFLQSIRACLDRFDGYAVIATHSPVVLQETPARFVHVLRRMLNHSEVVPSSIETFGESVSVITQEVFNLDDGATDWHETLRLLARDRGLEEIEQMFGRPLGFAARSYVLSVHDEEAGE